MSKNANIPLDPEKQLTGRRCVHMRLYKEAYYGLRGELYKNNITLQELFQEFVFLILKGDIRATTIIQEVVDRKKLKEKSKFFYKASPDYKAADEETIYDLIKKETNE